MYISSILLSRYLIKVLSAAMLFLILVCGNLSLAQEDETAEWQAASQEAIAFYNNGDYDKARERLFRYHYRRSVSWSEPWWDFRAETNIESIKASDCAAHSLFLYGYSLGSPDLELFKTLSKEHPDNWVIQGILAATLIRDAPEEAIRLFEELISCGHCSWWGYYALGCAYISKDFEKVAQRKTSGIRGVPFGIKPTQRALEAWEKAVQERTDSVTLWASLCWAYYDQGKYAEALKCCRQGLELDPHNRILQDRLHKSLFKTGHFSEMWKVMWQDPSGEGRFQILFGLLVQFILMGVVVVVAYFILRRIKRRRKEQQRPEPHPEIKWGIGTAIIAVSLPAVLMSIGAPILSNVLYISDALIFLGACSWAYLVVVTWLVWLARRKYGSIKEGLGFAVPFPSKWLWRIALVCVGLYAFNWLYVFLAEILGIKLQAQDIGIMIVRSKSTLEIGLVFFLVCGLIPVAEEIIYRACFYSALKKYLGIKWAVLISAVVFALMHMSLSYLIPLFVIGIVLALLFERTKSLLTSIITHGLFNFVSIILAFLFYQEGL